VLDVAVDNAPDEGMRSAWILSLVYRAIVELDAGMSASAHAAAADALDTARGFGLADYYGVAPAYAVRARTAVDLDLARADAQHGLALARRGSTELALAFVLTVCGDTIADLGDVEAGRSLLAEARTVVDRCPDPGIVGQGLRRAESRHRLVSPRPHSPEMVEQLTERELAVLRHLPSPLSQRDIASELYVSLNTVKTHCRAIYRKVNATDRKSAVQAARDHGLL
jgi:LuxR family maltose regulon positive regulatory protein